MITTARKKYFLLIFAALMLACQIAGGASHPRNNTFKSLNYLNDPWNYVDDRNWYGRAPDKWTHFMGSYALSKVSTMIVHDKYFGSFISLGLGLVKEYDDAYREGWSKRDIYMDLLGNISSLINSQNFIVLCYYDNQGIMIKASLLFK